jgi:class 3 adenylate cyclase/tetratricopeptide (TPR) repeat protein
LAERCARCGFDNGDGVLFCGGCGQKLPTQCAACGFANPDTHKFCGGCGARLDEAGHPSTPAARSRPAAGAAPVESDGERRQITVLFCDIVGSTEMSERVDPEELRDVVREYQAASAAVIERAGGHVAQYLGDGILAYFGYPIAHEHDARHAVHAGLGIVAAIRELGETMMRTRGFSVAVRCAIHTGPVVAGDMGARGSGARLAVGSTPNIAAHMQSVAPAGAVVLSASTRQLVQGWFELDALGPKRLKGRTEPMELFRAVREAAARSRSELDAAQHLSPLVGRREELSLLTRSLDAARTGQGQLVLLTGEAGVGKSRLVHLTRQRATHDGFACLIIRCASYFEDSALHPIIEMLQDDLGFERDDPPAVKLRKIERNLDALQLSREEHVPPLAALLSVPLDRSYPAVNLQPHKQKELAFTSLLALLAKIAERRSLLLVVEDLHWADPSTHEFLGLLVGQPPMQRAMMLMTARSEAGIPWAGRATFTRMTINRLSDGEVRTMIEQLAGDRRLPPEVLRELVKKTDGVPVFVEELTKMVLDAGLEVDESRSLSDRLLALAIPATLRDSLLARLDRMGDAKEVAQLGAVLGREFSFELLRAVADIPEGALTDRLARLVDANFLYQRGLPPAAEYTFKHALIQDAAYDLLLRSTRRQFHQRVADTIQLHFPAMAAARPEILARHLTEAGATEAAIGAWLRAGMRSLQQSANKEAIGQLQRGIDLLEELGDAPSRLPLEVGLLSALGPAYMATRGFAAPVLPPLYERLNAVCEQLGDVPELLWAARGVWVYYHVRADLVKAMELAKRVMRLAERVNVAEVLMEAAYTVACAHHFRGEFSVARPQFERILALDHPDRDHSTTMYTAMDVVATTCGLMSHTLWAVGDTDAAFEQARRGIAVATGLDHSLSHAFALYHLTCLEMFQGDRAAVKAHADELLRLSEERGLFFIAQAFILRGWATDREEEVQRGLQIHYQSGGLVGQTFFLYALADVQRRTGRHAAALERIDEALAAAAATHERWWDAELQRLRGEILIELGGDPAAAEQVLTDARLTAERQQAPAFMARIDSTLQLLAARPH